MVIDMALTAFEVFGVLKLDTTQFNKGLNDAKDHVSGISRAAGVIGGGLATAAKTGAAAIGAATAAVVGFSKTSVDEAISFESAFTGVKKTVDASAEDYDKLSSWIMDASTRMASSKEEIAGTMEIAGQLGIRGVTGLEKFTETMIMLGDTTNLNSEEAASALAKFGNIAGLKAEDMDRIGSTIVDLGNNFATTEADIVNMSTRLASAGTIAGLSATDILALSTAMSSVGINAEAGGTAMSQTLTTISKAAELAGTAADEDGKWAAKLAKIGETAGMSGEEFKKAWGTDAVGTLSKFITGLTNAESNGKSALVILDDLGMTGIRQSNMLQALSLANETLSGAIGMANTAFEENTALQHEAEMRYGTTESQMIQTKEAFKNLQVTVGKELMPTMSEFFSYSKTAIEDINKGLEQGGIEGMVDSIGTAISDALTQITEKLPQAIDLGIKLLSTLGRGLIENAPQIFNSLEKVADILLQHFWDAVLSLRDINFKDLGDRLGQAISDFFDSQNSALAGFAYAASRLIEYIGNGLSEAIPQLVPYVNDAIVSIADFLTQEGPKLIDTGVNILTSLMDGITETLPTLVTSAVDIVTTLVNDIAEQLPSIIESGVDMIIALAEALTNPDSITNIINSAITLIQKLADGIVIALPKLTEAAPKIIQNLVNAIVDNLPKLLEAALKIVVQLELGIIRNLPLIVKGAVEIVFSLINGIVKYYKNIFNTGVNLVKELWNGIKKLNPIQWGKDLISNFVQGIKNGWGELKGTLGELGDMIADYIGFSEPEKGPLSNFHTYAPDMMKLFAKGVKDNTRLVTDQIQKSFDFSDVIAEQSVNVNQPVRETETRTPGNIVINVYGAEGQDINALADEISYRLQHLYDVRNAVFA